MSEFTYNVNGLVSDSEATFATVQRAFAEAMARPPTAAAFLSRLQAALGQRIHAPRRKRAGQSSVPVIEADAPNVVWALEFQFDSTVDGRKIKIASMVDEHTRVSLLDILDTSIPAERLVAELAAVFAAAGGPPMVLRMDNGPEFISEALQQFCDGRVGISYIPPGTPWNNGFVESFNSRLRDECLNRNCWTSVLEARVVIGDFKDDHNRRHRHSALPRLRSSSTGPASPS